MAVSEGRKEESREEEEEGREGEAIPMTHTPPLLGGRTHCQPTPTTRHLLFHSLLPPSPVMPHLIISLLLGPVWLALTELL